MAYGKGMKKLSPCDDAAVIAAISAVCPAPAAILDIGCGRGERLHALSEHFPDAYCLGIDRDEENLAEAAKAFPGGKFLCADAEEMPVSDENFDLALCECSLSLFKNPDKCLREIYRALRPGGVLLLAEICTFESEPLSRPAPDGEALGSIFSRGFIEAMLSEKGFDILSFSDRSADLAAMAAQMIFDGSFCDCVGADTALMMRKLRAGYGLWTFRKRMDYGNV